MAKKLNLKISVFELVSYIVLGALAVWGIVYIVLGLVCATSLRYDSGLLIKDNQMKANGIGFLTQGVIILGVSVVAAVIVLLSCAKKSDKTFEKEQRRAARLNYTQNKVLDAKVEEKTEEK